MGKYEKRDTRDDLVSTAFAAIDKNNDGYIDKAEMKQVVGDKLKDPDIDHIIGSGDTNLDGRLDYEGL